MSDSTIEIHSKTDKLLTSKMDIVRFEMVNAIKSHDKERKDALSMLLAALKNEEIAKNRTLTEPEEEAVVQKEIKQTKETLDSCPEDREDIINQCKYRISLYEQFCPQMMSEDEINAEIAAVLQELGIETPTAKDKGKIMKVLMPRVKGKADGKLVNELLANKINA